MRGNDAMGLCDVGCGRITGNPGDGYSRIGEQTLKFGVACNGGF